jgi:hypothetical protein
MRRAWVLLPLLALVVAGCERVNHFHTEPHGLPMSVALAETNLRGSIDLAGEPNLITSADCEPGADGDGKEPNLHFRCDITFADRGTFNRVVHVLKNNQLIF